jgi:hypothetical protein
MAGLDLSAIANGALTSAVSAVGGWLIVAARKPHGRRAEDLSIARRFEAYRLTNSVLELSGISDADQRRFAEILSGDDIRATLQELLCARLTDAPEDCARGARQALVATLVAAEPHLAAYAEDLADYYDIRICDLVGELEAFEPSALPQIRAEAFSARIIAVQEAIARHIASLSAVDVRTESTFLASYRRHVCDYHSKLQPPDFDRRRLVPIEDIYVPARIFGHISPERRAGTRDPQAESIGLDELARSLDRTVLLGDPGAGKTTAAKVLMVQISSQTDRVPFLLTLRDYATADSPERSVVEHIAHDLRTFYQCPAPPGLIDRLLLAGRAVVIFDGLDELLDTSRRADVTARVERFCAEYPLARVLVTSRLIGYDEARLDDQQFTTYRLGEFSDDDVRLYVKKWFSQEEDARPGDADAFLIESASVPDLRSNPLLLALMCILYRGEGSLPRDRPSVYKECATLLFRRWDARRRIHAELRAGHLLEPALRDIAWWLYNDTGAHGAVTERDLIFRTAELLHGRGFESIEEAQEAAAEFVGFCRGRMWVFTETGTTASGEAVYAFTHRTFLEYFAASRLAYANDTPEELARSLAPRLARNEWSVVSELAVQIKDNSSAEGARRVFRVLLSEKRRRSPQGRSGILRFLARTLRSVDPSPAGTRELTREILRFLFAGDLDSGTYGLPLAWLLASCQLYRNIVAQEIHTWTADMIESADAAVRLSGLRLATSLNVPLCGVWRGEGPDLSAGDPQREFWAARASGFAHEYSDEIVAAAEEHPELLYLALLNHVITVDEAIMIGDGFAQLIGEPARGMFNLTYDSYLLSALARLVYGDPVSGVSSEIEAFEAAGRFLIKRPQAPWATQPMPKWSKYGGRERQERTDLLASDLSPTAYLGMAATLLICADPDQPITELLETHSSLGPISSLYPYMQCRQLRGSGAAQRAMLPDLPIPDPFNEVFKDWAEGRTDFTTRESCHLS